MKEAVELARGIGDKRELAAALNNLAQMHRIDGELDPAEPLYAHAVSLAREIGDQETVAIGLLNLAMVSIGRGAGDRARGMLTEILAIVLEIGCPTVCVTSGRHVPPSKKCRACLTSGARFVGKHYAMPYL